MNIELRIYQNDLVKYHIPEGDEILPIMDQIISFDRIINDLKKEEGGF